jgi:hypothetical protein
MGISQKPLTLEMVRALDGLLIENEHRLDEHQKGGEPRGRGRGDIAFLGAGRSA